MSIVFNGSRCKSNMPPLLAYFGSTNSQNRWSSSLPILNIYSTINYRRNNAYYDKLELGALQERSSKLSPDVVNGVCGETLVKV